MIDHISIPVTDLDRSVAFYTAALAPLGYVVLHQFPGTAGLGANGKADVWLGVGAVGHRVHVALVAPGRTEIRAFHAAGLTAGGTDNGGPGVRDFAPDYYAAFVLDPDGHNIEAVCRKAYLG